MKRILTFSIVSVLAVAVLGSCTKRDHWRDDNRNNKETGITVYVSEVGSAYSVVRMDYDGSYAVVYSLENDKYYWPEKNDVIYGDFSIGGGRTLYNKTAGFNIRLEVDDFFDYLDDAKRSVIRKEDQGTMTRTPGTTVNLQRRTGTPVNK
ncbi:hypothetical protein [Niabella drilacis]|uniref:Uncharacterized protein n=1 Tax=Niabella drilacis (strain DSM 25811 / CCM 8410 / CCUG 62505 / LMG 26954 / E90) TaxID=1285928 RepID=A0A1G6Y9P7_NIADE|nr:hypothetical protein [Niabella drilacis]SDD86971.1 hypothetical protein SAMN04487894_11531 [Niabella drilacis]